MAIYILLFFLLVYFSWTFDFKGKKASKLQMFFLFIPLVLVVGLRNQIGIDTYRYGCDFEIEIPTLFTITTDDFSNHSSQPLWFLLNVICKTVYDDFVTVQLVVAFLLHYMLFRFLLRETKYVFTCMLVIYCAVWWNFCFEIMRESLCVLIFLNALSDYNEHHKLYRYFLICLPALFIHWFSFIVIGLAVIYMLSPIKPLIVFSLLVGVLFYITDIGSIMNIASIYSADLSADASERVMMYMEGDSYGFIQVSFLGFLFMLLVQVLFPIVIAKSKGISPLYSRVLIMFVIFVFFRMKLLICERMINYVQILLIVAAVNYVMKKYSFHLLTYKYVLLCICYTMFNGVVSFYRPMNSFMKDGYDLRYIPYTSCFEEQNKNRQAFYNMYVFR